ncbi:MAG: hypothetical protein GY832_38310 [Chloroflexi bacterium]|nr:hypothetical protein [Chloroflexota bacterium]
MPSSGELIGRINHWLTFVLGAIVAGEALALLVGMNLTGQAEWAKIKNNGLALVDMVTGAALVYLLFTQGDLGGFPMFYVFLFVILISHGYREWEYVTDQPAKFCANLPLFVMNSVKLIGSVGVLVVSLVLNFQTHPQ